MSKLLAQSLTLPGGTTINGPLPPSLPGTSGPLTIGSILSAAVPLIFAFAGLGLLLMLIFAGYTFLTSAGDAKKMEQGKQQLTNAVVGFFIVFAAYWIVQLTGTIFGLESITSVFGK
jgi:Type IV secretion system pilin